MPLAHAPKHVVAALTAFLATAVLVWFGYGLHPLWPLIWIAPLPVLFFALRNSALSAGIIAGLAWLAGSLSFWQYFRALGTPFAVWLIVLSVSALAFASAVLLFRALARRGALWSAVLAFPAVWVSYEYLRNLATPHGTAGSIAYTQLEFLPFLQIASVAGPWGMSFLLFLFSAALAIGLALPRPHPKKPLRVTGGCLGILALVLIFGAIRLVHPQSTREVTVGLIASDQPARSPIAAEGEPAMQLFRDYAREAERLTARGAQVIVLAEKIGVVEESDAQRSDSIFQPLADKSGATIVVGEVCVSPQATYNQARAYAPGAAVVTYNKHHLLPPFESSMKPGDTLTMLREHQATWGVAICKDMDFTPLSRQYGRAGVGLMLVPAWDFRLDRWWHGHMAVMRGVEDGFSVARAARDGNLTISDDRGRILAETQSDSAPIATLLAAAPQTHDATLFLFLGDWFAWIALATLAFTALRLYRLRK